MTREPRTEAGRTLLRQWAGTINEPEVLIVILAIEDQAADAHDHDPDGCDECQAMVMEALRE